MYSVFYAIGTLLGIMIKGIVNLIIILGRELNRQYRKVSIWAVEMAHAKRQDAIYATVQSSGKNPAAVPEIKARETGACEDVQQRRISRIMPGQNARQ